MQGLYEPYQSFSTIRFNQYYSLTLLEGIIEELHWQVAKCLNSPFPPPPLPSPLLFLIIIPTQSKSLSVLHKGKESKQKAASHASYGSAPEAAAHMITHVRLCRYTTMQNSKGNKISTLRGRRNVLVELKRKVRQHYQDLTCWYITY